MNKNYLFLFTVLFNCIPIVGVAFYGWSVFEMFWLFWVETLIIAFFNTIRVLYAQGKKLDYSVINPSLKYNVAAACRYLIGRIAMFLFYSVFIIVFIGFIANTKSGGIDMLKTIAFLNPLFNLALILCACSQAYLLIRYYFFNQVYLHASPHQYPILFDGRQLVMHIAIVVGAAGSSFLFKGEKLAQYGAVWIIAIFCICKTVYEYSLQQSATTTVANQP